MSATDTWQGDSGLPRWDAAISSSTPASARLAARTAADGMGLHVSGFEDMLAVRPMAHRMLLRGSYAPLYYDLHRARRLADGGDQIGHAGTAALAAAMVVVRPPSLSAARAAFGDDDPDDVAREYFLWRHSMHVLGPLPPASGGLVPRMPRDLDLSSLDHTLRSAYGPSTRSPRAVSVAFADRPVSGSRGTTTPGGDMVLGRGGDAHDAASDAEQTAHSLLARHLSRSRDEFNAWMRGRIATSDPLRVLSRPSAMAGAHLATGPDGLAGDYSGEMALAMAHGVMAAPHLDPLGPDAPTDETVARTASILGVSPVRPARDFRMGPNV